MNWTTSSTFEKFSGSILQSGDSKGPLVMKFQNEQLDVEINAFVGVDGVIWFKGKEIA